MDIAHGFPRQPAPALPANIAAALARQVREELQRDREILASMRRPAGADLGTASDRQVLKRIALNTATLREMGVKE